MAAHLDRSSSSAGANVANLFNPLCVASRGNTQQVLTNVGLLALLAAAGTAMAHLAHARTHRRCFRA